VVSSVRRDGSLSRARTVWIVRVGDQWYLRSVNGPDAAWYRFTRAFHQGRIQARGVARDVTWIDASAAGQPDAGPAVDAEYARKYQGHPPSETSVANASSSRMGRSMPVRV
jgi:hypothetical protein